MTGRVECTCGAAKLLAATEDRMAQLEEELAQLRTAFAEPGWRAPGAWGLTTCEEALFACLLARGFATKAQLHAASATTIDGPETEPKIVDVWVCKVRAKLKRFGIEIETRWGRGYELAPAMREEARRQARAAAGEEAA